MSTPLEREMEQPAINEEEVGGSCELVLLISVSIVVGLLVVMDDWSSLEDSFNSHPSPPPINLTYRTCFNSLPSSSSSSSYMDRLSLLSFFFLLSAATATAGHATLPAQLYWHTVLPNTPMPNVIRALLRPDALNDEKTAVNVGKGGVYVNTPGKKKPVGVYVQPGYSPFIYQYAATETQIHDDPRVTLFFLEKDLHSGTKFSLHFTTLPSTPAFIPRRKADALPFSSAKLPEILQHFSVEPDSAEGKSMKHTLEECGLKSCATSLEAMVDFATSALGTRDVSALSTTVAGKGGATAEQTYTVASVREAAAGGQVAACHKEAYPYAVFFCHAAAARAFTVAMKGADGTDVKAAAVCHVDTSDWNSGHVAFRVLNVKPGSVPICHFVPEDHVVWARNK